jgi:hypothetical protein
MTALTPNPGDLILAAVIGVAVVIGLAHYLVTRPREGDGCRCILHRDLRAGR